MPMLSCGFINYIGINISKRKELSSMESLQVTDQNTCTGQAAKKDGKHLTFTLAGEDYGMGILKVKEIIGMMTITTIPQAPAYVKGVINLRGKVIPVVDLRLKFGMEKFAHTERTCIIVTETEIEGRSILIGILVDSVSEVLNIRSGDVEECPNFGGNLNTDYILGMAKIGGGVKILLDIDKVLGNNGMLETVLLQ
jgi:purine-binding chemotaxis protein CheW